MEKALRITGYHGTSEEFYEKILNNGYLKSGDNEWFGSGVYFFGDCMPITSGAKEAEWWVRTRRYSRWVILSSIIESEKYLDIAFCSEHRRLYEQIKTELIRKHRQYGKRTKDFQLRSVFIMLSKKDVDFIRAGVDAQRRPDYNCYVIGRYQIQICVKNIGCIKSTSLKRKGMRYGLRKEYT